MKTTAAAAAFLFVPCVVLADGPYAEVGLWQSVGPQDYGQQRMTTTTTDWEGGTTISLSQAVAGPYATLEVGYHYRGFSVSGLHISSAAEGNDKGANMLGVKYRFGKGSHP